MQGEYYVYKFSKGDDALYVGRTNNIEKRFNQHSGQPYFYESDKQEFISFKNKIDHMIAEMYLINKLKPKYNTEFNYDDADSELNLELPEFKSITDFNIKNLKSNAEINILKRNKQIEVERRTFPMYGFEQVYSQWKVVDGQKFLDEPSQGNRKYSNGIVEIDTHGKSIKRYIIYANLSNEEDSMEEEFYEEALTPEEAINIIFSSGLDKYFKNNGISRRHTDDLGTNHSDIVCRRSDVVCGWHSNG